MRKPSLILSLSLMLAVASVGCRNPLAAKSAASAPDAPVAAVAVPTPSPSPAGPDAFAITGISPVGTIVNKIPTQISILFNRAAKLPSATDIILTGTCGDLPTLSQVSLDTTLKIATATLTGGACDEGETLRIAIDPEDAQDTLGNAGTGATVSTLFTFDVKGPDATLGTPSATHLNATGTSAVHLTLTGAASTTLMNGSNAGIAATYIGSPNLACAVTVSAASVSGAVVTLSGCVGDGIVSLRTNPGIAKESLGNLSAASNSVSINIDNSAPVLSYLTPDTSVAAQMPAAITFTFNENVADIAASAFSLSGSCGSAAIASVVMSGGGSASAGNPMATVNLSGTANCASEGQQLGVTLNLASVRDAVGNASAGSRGATYTVSSMTAVLGGPTLPVVNTASSTTMAVNYTGTVAGASIAGGDIVLSYAGGGSPHCDAGVTNTGAVQLSNCTGDGLVTVSVRAGAVHDSLGHGAPATNQRTIVVANTLPNVVSTNQANFGSFPFSTTFVLNTDVANVPASAVIYGGSCVHVLPTQVTESSMAVYSIAMTAATGGSDIGNSIVTVYSNYGDHMPACQNGDTVSVTLDLTQVTNLAGAAGSGSASVTSTYSTPPVLTVLPAGDVTGAATDSDGYTHYNFLTDHVLRTSFDRPLDPNSLAYASFDCIYGNGGASGWTVTPLTSPSLSGNGLVAQWTVPNAGTFPAVLGSICTLHLAHVLGASGVPVGALGLVSPQLRIVNQ